MKPDTTDDIYLRREYEIIAPYKANSSIFSDKYDVEIWQENGKKIVLIRNKKTLEK